MKTGRWMVLAAAALCSSTQARDELTTLAAAAGAPEKRTALVVGNSNYSQGALKNPLNDARAVARELAASGFEVLLLEDGTQAGMQRAIRRFGDRIEQGGVGLFYYAGHGIQVKGRNFLVPVSADIDREYEVEYSSVDVSMVLAMMDAAKNPLNIVILDACRNNPFARSLRVAAAGLAPLDAPAGTFIAFATAPGAIASDGIGDNGVYTKHLLAHLGKPGMPIEQLFKQVRIGVMGETGGAQTPWESSSLRGDFAFRPGIPAEAAATQLVTEALKRDREAYLKETEVMIQVALERQRRELEEQAAKTPAPVAAIVPASSWAYRLRDGRGANRIYSPDDAQLAPYVVELDGQLRAGRRLSRMPNFDAGACKSTHLCTTRGRVVGREIVMLGAERFETTKVVFEQNWQPRGVFVGASFGSRRITVWYSPEAKRTVKVSSRVIHGYPPMEANFDLELVDAQAARSPATQVAHTGGRK